MKAAILRELGKPVTIESIDVPRLGEGHVLVRMQMAAVCHSQKLEVTGARGPDRFLPHLIGHEGVGLVEDTGLGVTKVRSGDQVVLSWIRGSGKPAAQIVYDSPSGKINAGPIATFCERPIIAEQCVTRIHPQIAPEIAVLAGCAVPTGAGTVWNCPPADIRRDSVCILGAGGIGLSAIAGAKVAEWKNIVAVDLKESRLSRARELGATQVVKAGEADTEAKILALTEGKGFDLVVECAGASATMEMAPRLARTQFGYVIIAGNLPAGKKISIDPFDLIKGRWLGGSWGGQIQADRDIPKIVAMLGDGRLNHRLLGGKIFTLDQVNDAIEALTGADPGRPLIAFGKP